MLENAKNEAAEALRSRHGSRMRKSSIELHEALNYEEELEDCKDSNNAYPKLKKFRKLCKFLILIQPFNDVLTVP